MSQTQDLETAPTARRASLSRRGLQLNDSLLIGGMALLAGCGLIYEYLLSHYAGRVLGAYESTLYAMIGLMIVAMGLGSFYARRLKDAVFCFALLEALIALLGSSAIVVIATLIGFSEYLPQLVGQTFGFPPDSLPRGGLFHFLLQAAHLSPFVFGIALGFLIGMEIPLIARVREQLYQRHLVHNTGTIYGADYIGAGIGAAVWVLVLLRLEINQAAALTASMNLLVGVVFMVQFRHQLRWRRWLWSLHGLLLLIVIALFHGGSQWIGRMGELLYLDQVVYQAQTRYQQLVFTRRVSDPYQPAEYNFYINGRLQFASQDEQIYHSLLTYPALAGSARQEKVLIIGGGDGLALRDVLRWQPQQVTLIDLDAELVERFQQPHRHLPGQLADALADLNQGALADPRLELITADAFVAIDPLLQQGRRYDTIILDLPDPSHPDLNKLYSRQFYARLRQLLAADGLLVTQSTSPYHAKDAFISIGRTLASAGYTQVQQYHANVPSFGEWGWTIAAPTGTPPRDRLRRPESWRVSDPWLTPGLLQGAFEFPAGFYDDLESIEVNHLGSHVLYQYHHNAWTKEQNMW